MRRKYTSWLLIFFLISSLFNGLLVTFNPNNIFVGASDITVGDTGNYQYIQDAINNSDNGDTIFVWAGTYDENITVNKSINLVGNSSLDTIINCTIPNAHAIIMDVNYVNLSNFTIDCNNQDVIKINSSINNVAIENCIIIGESGDSCIIRNDSFVGICTNILINNNTFVNGQLGIYFYQDVTHSVISNNTIYNQQDTGIDIIYCDNITIFNNTVYDQQDTGIYIAYCDNITSSNNILSDCDYGILLDETETSYILNNTITNSITEGIYLDYSNHISIYNNSIDDSEYGIGFYNSGYTTIDNNVINDASFGIDIYCDDPGLSDYNIIENNLISITDRAINIDGNSDIEYLNILNNTITEESSNAIYIYNGHYFMIDNNTIADNDADSDIIYLEYSEYCTISNNTITGNTAGEGNCIYIYADGIDSHMFIENNLISDNNCYALYIMGSSCIIQGNTISNNLGYGIQIIGEDAYENLIYNNILINNSVGNIDLFDTPGGNLFNITKTLGTNIVGGPYLGGNYYDDYTGSDADNDGLGDTPYTFDTDGIDYHPLIILPAFTVNVYNESNCSESLTFDILITNNTGTKTYERKNCVGYTSIDNILLPTGEDVIVLVSANGYNQRMFYIDIIINQSSNLSVYLPQKVTEGEEPECGFRQMSDSILVTSYIVDTVIPLTNPPDTISSVQLYNKSLYISYGGWIEISANSYNYTTENLIINSSVLDENITIAKVIYEYEYCPLKSGSYLYQLSVYNGYDQPVENAKIIIKRYINCTGVFTNMSILYTDGAGLADIYLIPGILYQFTITKDTFEPSMSYWTPTNVVFVHRFVLRYIEISPPEYIEPIITALRIGTTIYANYTDTMDATITVVTYFYYVNASTGNLSLVATITNYTNIVNNELLSTNTSLDYKVKFVYNHTYYGLQTIEIIIPRITLGITTPATLNTILVRLLGDAGPFLWTNVILFLMFTVMMFHSDKKNAGKYLIIIGGIMALVAFIGFNDALAGTIPVLFVLVGIIVEWINAGR